MRDEIPVERIPVEESEIARNPSIDQPDVEDALAQ